MKKIILLLTLVISLFAFSASKGSKKTKRKTTSTRTKSTKKDAMNMRRFSFLDLAKYPDPNRKPPTNYKKVREEYFKKHPNLKP
ncbi:hypothetical protein AB8B22_09575 [Leptotrichia sp. HSP-334]|uniref:Uncharacterized protein n=1 Tax=Leptotrichia rugosa TaxID=3239302 RepID=A0AB39VG21_9FUSO|nr:hypothetical protein [uncultured Leptotrichia sp.]